MLLPPTDHQTYLHVPQRCEHVCIHGNMTYLHVSHHVYIHGNMTYLHVPHYCEHVCIHGNMTYLHVPHHCEHVCIHGNTTYLHVSHHCEHVCIHGNIAYLQVPHRCVMCQTEGVNMCVSMVTAWLISAARAMRDIPWQMTSGLA